MRPMIAIGVIVILLVVGKMYLFTEATSGAASARASTQGSRAAPRVNLYIAHEVLTENTIYATGTITPNEEVELRSEVSGRLVALHIREGAYVPKGELIAKIDDSDLQARLKKLNYEEELAARIEARQQKLLDIDAISKEEYDIAVNEVNTLSADKELLMVQLDKTEIRAPFAGYIGFKHISVGSYLTPSLIIATIVQTNPVKIDFTIPEKYASLMRTGLRVQFQVDGQSAVYTAKVIAIDPKVDEELRTLSVRGRTSNPSKQLLPGMFARLTVPLGSERSISIPTDAVVPILKGKMVYVLHGGQVVGKEVITGVRTDQHVQVREGLELGDSVIVSALMSIKPGMMVKVGDVTNTPLN